jgi:hypothetical protein
VQTTPRRSKNADHLRPPHHLPQTRRPGSLTRHHDAQVIAGFDLTADDYTSGNVDSDTGLAIQMCNGEVSQHYPSAVLTDQVSLIYDHRDDWNGGTPTIECVLEGDAPAVLTAPIPAG